MPDVVIGAKMGRLTISRAARANDFSGYDSRGRVVRFSLLREILGLSHEKAMELSEREPMNNRAEMEVTENTSVRVKIDAELLSQIESSPVAALFKNRSQMIRYALLRADGYGHDEAMDEAIRPIGRPRKSSETKQDKEVD